MKKKKGFSDIELELDFSDDPVPKQDFNKESDFMSTKGYSMMLVDKDTGEITEYNLTYLQLTKIKSIVGVLSA